MPSDRCLTQLCRMRCLVALTLAALATFLSIIVVGMTTTVDQGVRSGLFVVDTDAGTDDAMALLLLLEAERRHRESPDSGPKILAITAVNGNTNVDNVCRNVLRILSVVDRLDIPVYRGACKSLKSTPPTNNFFGVDGMGDVPVENAPDVSLLQEDHAVLGLIKLVNENPGQINLLMMGPLTNLALAIRLDEKFLDKVKHVYILGGAANGRGNVAPGVEFNFYMDPEANYAVLSDTDYSSETITLMPLEPSLNMKITQRWRSGTLGAISSVSMDFLNKIEHIGTAPPTDDMWVFPDPILVAATLKPELITRTDFHAIVTLTQGETRGGVAVDYDDLLKTRPKLTIIQDFDEEAYKKFLLNYLS